MNSLRLAAKFLFIFTVLSTLVLLLSCVCYFTGITLIPILGLIGIGAPIIIVVNILFLIFWLFKRSKVVLFPLTALILATFIFGPFYKLSFNETSEGELSIMTFNTRGFNRYHQIEEPNLDKQIIDLVKELNPDIVCFQEFDYTRSEDLDNYPYQYVQYSYPKVDKVVQAILSKYPITEKGVVNFPDTSNNTIYADVQYGDQFLRIYNVHLQSYRIIPSSEKILGESGDMFLKRLQTTFSKQETQAKLVRDHSRTTRNKTIICGDFNNTHYSTVYRILKSDLRDTHKEKGNGFGGTFHLFNYPLRIDYILVDPSFQVMSHSDFSVELSDHEPVMASISLESE